MIYKLPTMILSVLLLLTSVAGCNGDRARVDVAFARPYPIRSNCLHPKYFRRKSPSIIRMNILDIFTGGAITQLSPQDPSNPPLRILCPGSSASPDLLSYAISERPLSFTGEDFDVYCGSSLSHRVRGAMLHLPGKDKMTLTDALTDSMSGAVERKLMALKPAYDIFDHTGTKVGWMEKKIIGMGMLTDTFEVFNEFGKRGMIGALGQDPPVYTITGNFIDRNYVIRRCDNDEAVAKVCMDGLFQFDNFNHYQVQVAPGMDGVLVLACVCALDEEHDEEHQKRKEEEEKKRE